jgi:hypothetical protein
VPSSWPSLSPNELHRRLDHYAKLCCPVLEEFTQRYHWSLMQVEYATDLLFRSEAMLGPLYEQLSRQAVLAVKAWSSPRSVDGLRLGIQPVHCGGCGFSVGHILLS